MLEVVEEGTDAQSQEDAADLAAARTQVIHEVPSPDLDASQSSLLSAGADRSVAEEQRATSPAVLPDPPESLSGSEYLRLLQDRLQLALDRNEALEKEVDHLQAARQKQAVELQSLLLATMQRQAVQHRAPAAATPNSSSTDLENPERPDQALEDTVTLPLSSLSSALTAASGLERWVSALSTAAEALPICVLDNVAQEGELHRCAMQQAEYIRTLDSRYPEDMSKMTSQEHNQMTGYRAELAEAAQAKDDAHGRLQQHLNNIEKAAAQLQELSTAIHSGLLAQVNAAASTDSVPESQ
ncbi:uncharacterized protein MONBRDRAFT_28296 [Monosiga brevicollis MX1]|uniref:Uncharacterized protein n=1 Tax=Monosiga brevicollis TaxID=81824 RepID=A9V7R7_MONBE|nr:uncharacterized protein MONBRDRAFT_28296 [Monosiga brevicollis MX1]EDQ86354.1 predicted protein [Monosiga brevicollis MX1]|eukprot:XP_001748744.1 hypothetical protein [Monosiga brevicollis MX1]